MHVDKSFFSVLMQCRPSEAQARSDLTGKEKKKPRPKDVFGRTLPTEEEFDVLKNAPRYVLFIAFFILFQMCYCGNIAAC